MTTYDAIADFLLDHGQQEWSDMIRAVPDRGVKVVDQDGVLKAFPAIRQVINDWVRDPEPKLANLVIEVRTDPDWRPGRSRLTVPEMPGLEITMYGRVGDQRWQHSRIISRHEMDRFGGLRWPGLINRTIDLTHRNAIQAIRINQPATSPG